MQKIQKIINFLIMINNSIVIIKDNKENKALFSL
jgi:hypothetical protein